MIGGRILRRLRPDPAALRMAGALVPVLAVLLAASPAPAAQQSFPRYFELSCRDLNQDGIDDFFDDLTGLTSVDVMVVFDPIGYSRSAAETQVAAALGASQPSAVVSYAATHSPYVFARRIALSNPPSATPALNAILNIPGVVGIRSYQRFRLYTEREQYDGRLRNGLYFPEEGTPGSTAPRTLHEPIQPVMVPPEVLVYFIDSGIDKRVYWGIDVTRDDPMAPAAAVDPLDASAMKHGSFLKSLAEFTVQSAQALSGGGSVQFADVKVAAGPNGETTTEELTKALDAVVAHIQSEAALGRTFDVVVNISYDTDGGIANHDIIYPASDGPPAHSPGRSRGPGEPGPLSAAGGNPCGGSLFDTVYRTLGTNHAAVICVGAGNDGEVAAFALNEVAQSANTTLVATALDDASMAPAPWSNYGKAPNGTNGHPDIAAPGTSGSPGFGYLLQGTSVSTAFASAMAAVKLSLAGPTTPQSIAGQLVSEGAALAPVGSKYYGDAILKLPWFPDAEPVEVVEDETEGLRITATPNPARPVTRLSADLDSDGPVRVEVFDIAGRLRRCLCDGFEPSGPVEWVFDGRDDFGRPLPGGLYLARIAAGGREAVVRVMVEK